MKIAIVSNFPIHVIPEFGEAYRPAGHYATWLPQLARAFSAFTDLEIHWVTLFKELPSPRRVSWCGQTFHVLPAGRGGLRAPTLYYQDQTRIHACLREIGPELVHGWGTEDVYALAAVNSGFPNLVSMQGILSEYVLKAGGGARHYLQALLELFALIRADALTVESAWGKDLLLKRNPSAKIEVIEYGVDDHFLERPWKPDPAQPSALFVGSIVAAKGIQDLIAAYADPALAGYELWIAGSGPEEWVVPLRQSSSPNVRWLGRLPSTEIAELMSRAWCLALPTRVDTSPNVVKEARVIGLPVITTRCGGQATYVDDRENGFLVEPEAISHLREALATVLGNLDRCRAMGAHRHKEHRELLHPHLTARKFAEVYRSSQARG